MSIQYKLIALLVALLAMVSGAWWLQSSSFSKGHAAGVAEVRAEVQAVALQAERDNAANHEQQIQKLMEAQHAKDKRLQTVAADNDRARLELERLRVALAQRDAGGSELPPAVAGPVAQYTNPLAELLEECSRRYIEVARQADGHAADAVNLRDAWPK
jgi:GAF domain-containing protein